jgi:hypothetical protein
LPLRKWLGCGPEMDYGKAGASANFTPPFPLIYTADDASEH